MCLNYSPTLRILCDANEIKCLIFIHTPTPKEIPIQHGNVAASFIGEALEILATSKMLSKYTKVSMAQNEKRVLQ